MSVLDEALASLAASVSQAEARVRAVVAEKDSEIASLIASGAVTPANLALIAAVQQKIDEILAPGS